jgi:hypothetical protein
MSHIALPCLPSQQKIGDLFSRAGHEPSAGRRPMTTCRRSCANRILAALSGSRVKGHSEAVVTGTVRALKLTVADALCAYALTGSAFATLLVLAAPHLEVFTRCFFHGKG